MALGTIAFALTALFSLVRNRLGPGNPGQTLDPVLLGFSSLLATGLAFFAQRDVLQKTKTIERERELFRTIMDSLPNGVFAKDRDGRFVFVNRKYGEYKGTKADADVLGKTVFDFFPEDLAAVITAEDLQLIGGASPLFDREVPTVDGRGNIKWESTTRVPLIGGDGKIVGVAGIQRDITRSKRIEQKLRQQEARLLAAQQIAQLGSFEVDLIAGMEVERCPMRCSAEVLRIAGFEPTQDGLPRASTNIFHLVIPGDASRVKKTMAETVRDAKPYVVDFRILCRNGTQRNVQCAGDVICEPETGRPAKLQGVVADITERKRAEAELEAANENLEKHVNELQERSKGLHLLGEMGGLLQSCNSMEEAFVAISASAEPLFANWTGALYMMSASRNIVEVVAQWGPPVRGQRVFAPEDCWALRRGRLNWFNRRESGMLCPHADDPGVTESLCVPFNAHGETLGVLHLQPKETPGPQTEVWEHRAENDAKLASLLAEQIGLALGNLKLRETLRNQSVRDALTGLFNRRYLEESLERETSRAIRDQSSIAILMFDIDHFKDFNDLYGHLAGDAVLRALGNFLTKNTRGQDIVCRYGGEEFALVLGGATLEGALRRAQELRESIKHLEVESSGHLLRAITVSIGVGVFPDHGSTVAEILRSADQALYRAKREGRDQVCVWTAGSPA